MQGTKSILLLMALVLVARVCAASDSAGTAAPEGNARVFTTGKMTLTVIDAHTIQEGDFRHRRQIRGKVLYFSEAGDQAVERLEREAMKAGSRLAWDMDPGRLEKEIFDDPLGRHQLHKGDPERAVKIVPALCEPLARIIASDDFKSLRKEGSAQTANGVTDWILTVTLPGASTAAIVFESERVPTFYEEFGAWNNNEILEQPILPDQVELDGRFKSLVNDLITCLPDWKASSDGTWHFALHGPRHTITLYAANEGAQTRLAFYIDRKAVKPAGGDVRGILLQPPLEELFVDNRRGWHNERIDRHVASIGEGAYRINNKLVPDFFTWIPVSMQPGSDYTYSLDLKLTALNSAPVGILWALDGRENFNALYLTGTGSTTWGESLNGKWSGQEWKACECDAPVFSVVIQRIGNTVSLRVNDKKLGSMLHSWKGSRFGLSVAKGAGVVIRRVSITTP